MIGAPDFWWHEQPSAAARLLQPVGAVWGAVAHRRMQSAGTRLPIPVLCVGNFVAGGAGKTPTALALEEILSSRGHRPAFVSRGYGRRSTAPGVLRVDLARHGVDDAGDEPLLLAGRAPTYVSSDRLAAGRHALADGATVLVLDDGLQNAAVVKTLAMAVVDGATGIGNGLCLPAGPLRASLDAQWPRIAAVCIVGHGPAGERVALAASDHDCPVVRGHLKPDVAAVETLRGKPLFAFAGIGRPAKFFATLRDAGLDLKGTRAFPDHHRFSETDRDALRIHAASGGLHLVTTSKDAMRLPRGFETAVLPVELVFEDPSAVVSVLGCLDPIRPHPSP